MPDQKSDLIKKEFVKYLDSLGLSPASHKNYRSDLGYFVAWAILKIRSFGSYVESLAEIVPFLNNDLGSEYKNYMAENLVPVKTMNRRLSTLRHLSRFLVESHTIDRNFTQGVENMSVNLVKKPKANPIFDNFKKYLEDEKVSPNTIKNYLSDIKHFLSSLISLSNISEGSMGKYWEELGLRFSSASIKRKNISIGKFLAWAKVQGHIEDNPLAKISDPIFPAKRAGNTKFKNQDSRFKKWFKGYRTIPGVLYLNIIVAILLPSLVGLGIYNQFFKNAKSPFALTALNRPSRYLSFQGRLTNQFGNPITVATNVVFKLYDAASAGTTLWNSGTCSVSPDTDGVFSTLLGSGCGTELASTVFSDNAAVWLGVTVAADTEATPRIQIATVAYALNSETLQGYPASSSATINTVPVINNSGQMVIAASSPKIQSTAGTFAIEGQALSITTPTASNGNVTIAPDGTGVLNLTFAGAAPGGSAKGFVNATDANLTGGALYYGEVANDASGYNLLKLASGATPRTKFAVDSAGNATLSGTINGLAISGGTISTGTWQGTAVGAQWGGTGANNSTAAQYSVPYYSSTGVMGGVLAPGTDGYVLTTHNTGGVPTWTSTAGFGTNYWNLGTGTIYPGNTTMDLLIGNSATTSAKFAFTGVNSGTPTASIAGATNVATYLTGNGNLATTNMAHLTLGGATTGMVDVSNDLNLATGKAYYINNASVLNSTTLGTSVATSSLTTVGALASGSIANGFGTILTANTITGTTLNGTTGVNTGAGSGTQRIDATGNLVNIANISASGYATISGSIAIGNTTALVGPGNLNASGRITGVSIYQGANQVCDSSGTGCPAAAVNYWALGTGTIYPGNTTMDLLIGNSATTSAKFAFKNVLTGTPTASISGSTAGRATYLTGDGTLAMVNAADLTLGSSTTGRVIVTSGATNTIIANGTLTTVAGNLDSSAATASLFVTPTNLTIGTAATTLNMLGATGATMTLGNVNGATAVNINTGTGGTTYTTTNGIFTLNTGTGNISLGADAAQKNITIGNQTGTSAVTIDSGTGAINIGTAIAKTITLGNATTTTALNYTSGTGAQTFTSSVATGQALAGAFVFKDATLNSGDLIYATTSAQTSGNLLHIADSGTSAFSGNMINLDANYYGGGTFTGNFLKFSKNGVNVFTLDNAANASMAGTLTFGGTAVIQSTATNPLTIGGATTGNITLNPLNAVSGGFVAPQTTNVTNLGTASLLWKDIYATTLHQGANLVCDASGANCPASTNYWALGSGTIYPGNTTLDLLIGNSATTSAKFAFTGVNSGTPTASISGSTANVATYLTGSGNLATTNMQPLTIGGATTGSIQLNPKGSTGLFVDGTGNVGIGTTGPTEKLHVSGNVRVQDGSLALTLGQKFLPHNTDTGYYLRVGSSSPWPFQISATSDAGTNRPIQFGSDASGTFNPVVHINTYTGNVGIGTTNPSQKLDVAGNFNLTGYATMSGSLAVGNTNATQGPGNIDASGRITGTTIYQGANQVCDVSGNCTGSSVVKWRENLGTLSPYSSTLDVLIGSNATSSAKFAFTGVNSGTPTASIAGSAANVATYLTGNGNLATTNMQPLTIGGTTTGSVQLNPKGSTGLFVDGAGNVGIGDANPTVKLQITGTTSSLAKINIDNTDSGSWHLRLGADSTNKPFINTANSDPLYVQGQASAGNTILNAISGNTGVATTTPTALLDVNGNASVSGTLAFHTGTGTIQTTTFSPLVLGGATTGNITLNPSNAVSGGYVAPATTNVTNLGTASLLWKDIYATTLHQGANLVCDASGANCPAGTNYWNLGTGTIYPGNTTLDLLLGSSATTSAKFAFTGVAGGTPTASIAGSTANVATYLTGNGTLATTNMAHLTLGGSSTGGIDLGSPITSGTWNGSAIGAVYGGTGQTVYAIGDILYANSTTSLAKLADVATGNVLISGGVGVAPSWGKVVLGTHTTGNYVSSIVQTANQISASSTTGDVTLSIPSDFRAPGTVNAVNGLYTGATAGTQRIDATGNLVNIANISASGYATVSGSIAIGNATAVVGPGNLNMSGNLVAGGTINGLTVSSGTITGGTWNGTAIGTQYGGTGQNWSATAQGSIPYFSATGVMSTLAPTTAGYVLSTNGAGANPSWIATSALGTNYWNLGTGTIYPGNTTLDLLLGNSATTSAKFAFTGVNSGTPIASIAGSTANVATYLTGNGTLATTNMAHLTLGGATTGMVDVSNDLNLATGKAYYINNASVLNSTTLGTSVVTSSLTTVGILASGSINTGFGTILTGNTITGTTLNGTTGVNTGAGSGTQRIDATGNLVNIANISASGYATVSGSIAIGNTTALAGPGNLNASGRITGVSIYQGANQVCDVSGNCSAIGNYWQLTSPVVSPANTTYDLAIGGTGTSSAKFQVFGAETATSGLEKLTSTVTTTGNVLSATASGITSGNIAQLGRSGTTAFSGNMLQMDSNFYGGGTFTGNFLKFNNNGTTMFTVDNSGNVAAAGVGQFGGLTTAAYSRFGTAATSHAGNLTTASDLQIGSNLEVDSTLYLDGGIIANSLGTVTVSFPTDPTAINSYNTLGNGSWLATNTVNPGIAALMVNQAKGGDIFSASASGTAKMTLNNIGNLGIGTSSPTSLLHINNTISSPVYDTTSSSATSVNASTLSWSHVASTCSNRIIVVGVGTRSNTAVNSITYNSVNLTKIRSDAPGVDVRSELWYLVNPASGSNTVAITLAGSTSITAGATTLCGVDQITPYSNNNGATGTSTTPSVNVTSATGELVLDIVTRQSVGTFTVGAGQTKRWDTPSNVSGGAGSTEPGAATVTMDWTTSVSDTWAISAASFKPSQSLFAISDFGVNRLTVLNNGNVGIGTTVPSQKLHIDNGNVLVATGSGNLIGNLFFGGDTSLGNNGMRMFNVGDNSYIDSKQTTSTNGLRFRTDTTNGGTDRMIIRADGNVGIGTIAPGALLDVQLSSAPGSGVSPHGLNVTNTLTAGQTNNFPSNYIATIYNTASTTQTNAYGLQTEIIKSNTGPLTSGYSSFSRVQNTNATGAIASAFDYYAAAPVATGAITTAYGLYVESLKIANVTTGYGIYQAGTGDLNYFAGNVGIGTTAPSNALVINSDVLGAAILPATTISVGNSTGNSVIQLGQASAATGKGYLKWNYNATPANAYFTISTASTQNISLQENGGNVGIGTTVPASKLALTSTGTFAAAGISGLDVSAHTVTLSGANPTTYATFYANSLGAMTLTGTNANQTVTTASTLYVANPAAGANVTITNNRPINTQSGAYLTSGGVWTGAPSYRRYKDNFTSTSDYLDKLANMDLYEWQYKNEVVDGVNRYLNDPQRHASPFLDDFYAIFGLSDDKGVNMQDLAGVALASVKELNTRFENFKTAEISRDLALTNTGDLNITATGSGNYVLTNTASNSVIDKIGAFADMIAANVKAGAVIASDLAVTSFTAFQGTIDNLLIKSGLVAGNIQTKLISPLADGTDVTVQIGSNATPSGQFIVQNASGSTVASIDASGNATFSGTLYADKIKSQSLDDIKTVLTQVQTDQNLLKQAANWSILTATNSANLNQLAVADLYITNQAAINSLSVTNTVTVGSDLVFQSLPNSSSQIPDSSINTLSAPLKLQSLAMAPLEIMNGLVTIDTKGNVNIAGDLFVAGRIKSSGLTLQGGSLQGLDATASANLLSLQDNTGLSVASVDASGSAEFGSVSTPQLVIAGADATQSGTIINGVITTNSTVGQAIIPAGIGEITIKNPKVTDYTLVYVTPTSSTENNVLYVKSKQAGQFVVGFAYPISTDVSFNWWIIQVVK